MFRVVVPQKKVIPWKTFIAPKHLCGLHGSLRHMGADHGSLNYMAYHCVFLRDPYSYSSTTSQTKPYSNMF